MKIHGPTISVKFSGVRWSGPCRDIPFKVNKLLHLSSLTTKKGAENSHRVSGHEILK